MNASLAGVTLAQLKQAIVIKEKIEALERELATVWATASPAGPTEPRRRGRLSAAVRARMAAARRAWWAKRKGGKAVAPLAKPKREISRAGRLRLARLAKARWAKVKAAGKTSLKAG